MQCLRCKAEIKDNSVVCPKCGFIVKGARELDHDQAVLSFEDKVERASIEELKAMLYEAKGIKISPKKLKPGQTVAKKGKAWATLSLICGIFSCVLVFVPGINSIAALLLFILAFIGFGKSSGYGSGRALAGVIMTVISIAASWIYNAYFAQSVGSMLGLYTAEEAADAAAEAAQTVA